MLASSIRSVSSLSPKEKTRPKELALMEDEDREMDEPGGRWADGRTSACETTPGASSSTSTSVASLPSMVIPSSPTASIRAVKGAPRCVARREIYVHDSLPSDYLAFSMSPSPPEISLPSEPTTPPGLLSHPAYQDLVALSPYRRNSRVWYSEIRAPPAESFPGPTKGAIRRASSIENSRANLAIRAAAQILPRRSCCESTSSLSSDPFVLQGFSPPTSELSQITINEEEDAFDPQPLPYPKVPTQLTTLDTSVTHDSLPSSNSPGCDIRPTGSYGSLVRDSFASIVSTLLSLEQASSLASASFSTGHAYTSIVQPQHKPGQDVSGPSQINRETCFEDLGLSPRSGPMPGAKPAVKPTDKMRDSGRSELVRTERMDSIDFIAPLDESHSTVLLSFPVPPVRTATASFSINRSSSVVDVEAVVEDPEDVLDTPRPDAGPKIVEARPPSPAPTNEIPDTAREQRVGRPSNVFKDEAESDLLDLRGPLVQSALKSQILTLSSRLLNARPSLSRKASTSSSISKNSGWSGSESEEEDFVSAIRNIRLRKLFQSKPLSPPKIARPSLLRRASSRLSQLSETSTTSTPDSVSDILTPNFSFDTTRPRVARFSSTGSKPGDFAWGRSNASSPTDASFAAPSKDFFEIFRTPSQMPRPRLVVDGWGEPEILVDDDDWPGTAEGGAPGSDRASIPSTKMGDMFEPTRHCFVQSVDEEWLLATEIPVLLPGLVDCFGKGEASWDIGVAV